MGRDFQLQIAQNFEFSQGSHYIEVIAGAELYDILEKIRKQMKKF